MADIVLTCPHCGFSKPVKRPVSEKMRFVRCPRCEKSFPFALQPALSETGGEGPLSSLLPMSADRSTDDLRNPRNILLALCFILVFFSLLAGRLYSSHRAQNAPSPNFIAASGQGIATLWHHRIMVTDGEGGLIRQIDIPKEIEPTQLLWAGEELWVADYRTKRIFRISPEGESWFTLNGPAISAHFKIAPDFLNDRIFVADSAGHDIHLYDGQGKFRSSFGKKGGSSGELKFPNQFLLETSGDLLLSNTKSPGIDRYSPQGRFLGRVVKPTGHPEYKYPTVVALAAERIVTLENDGYLRDGRIALYSREGDYLGTHEPVEDFKLIGDIAVSGDRVLATDLANAKVYAFAVDDLKFLGEYSADLRLLGEESRQERRRWERLSQLNLLGMVAILVPVVYFYARFRIRQSGRGRPEAGIENLWVSRQKSLEHIELDALGPIDFIAVETRQSIDILAVVLMVVPFLGILLLVAFRSALPRETATLLLALGALLLAPGTLLATRASWGSPVALKRARAFLRKLAKDKGMEMLAGVEKVAIAYSPDKTTQLLLFFPHQVTVAEFNPFGRLSQVYRLPYERITLAEKKFIMPAFSLNLGGKEKIVTALDKKYMTRLRSTLEEYLSRNSSQAASATGGDAQIGLGEGEPDRRKNAMNPKAALLSALYPGLGQFYKRHIVRGALFIALFTFFVFILAVNLRPALDGSIDWDPGSIRMMTMTLYLGLVVFLAAIWDALKG